MSIWSDKPHVPVLGFLDIPLSIFTWGSEGRELFSEFLLLFMIIICNMPFDAVVSYSYWRCCNFDIPDFPDEELVFEILSLPLPFVIKASLDIFNVVIRLRYS